MYDEDGQGRSSFIVCEGVFGYTTRCTFHNRAEKSAHAKQFCMTENCKNCGIYRLNMKKYED
jgi:hypothetical protein